MHEFITWLYETRISTLIRDVPMLIPAVQSVHIIAIATLVGSAFISDLRLAGVLATDETPATVVRRHLPWLWGALLTLLATGTILSVGEPDRVFSNWMFWLKMTLVLLAFTLTLLFRKPLLDSRFRIEHSRWAKMAPTLAWLSLAIWVGIIFCGRWIAYTLT